MSQEQLAFSWNEPPTPEVQTQRPAAIAQMKERLDRLAERRVYVGTSSWKYPGWLDQVYSPARYITRSKFSKKKFTDGCLEEYAATFKAVCGDFAFYQFPSEEAWKRTFAPLPPGFQFCCKIPEDVTVERFPNLPRYGKRAGMANGHFMDAALVQGELLDRLEPYRDRLGTLIFEFGTIHDGPMREPPAFAASLGKMLSKLPTDRFRLAVEVRNPEFIGPDSPYLDVLREHKVAHCLNSWTRMPSLAEQLQIPGIFTAPHVAARMLLKPGRSYQTAVEQFSPYQRIQDPYPEARAAIRELIELSIARGYALYVLVNNRLEGNAIETIAGSI